MGIQYSSGLCGSVFKQIGSLVLYACQNFFFHHIGININNFWFVLKSNNHSTNRSSLAGVQWHLKKRQTCFCGLQLEQHSCLINWWFSEIHFFCFPRYVCSAYSNWDIPKSLTFASNKSTLFNTSILGHCSVAIWELVNYLFVFFIQVWIWHVCPHFLQLVYNADMYRMHVFPSVSFGNYEQFTTLFNFYNIWKYLPAFFYISPVVTCF